MIETYFYKKDIYNTSAQVYQDTVLEKVRLSDSIFHNQERSFQQKAGLGYKDRSPQEWLEGKRIWRHQADKDEVKQEGYCMVSNHHHPWSPSTSKLLVRCLPLEVK